MMNRPTVTPATKGAAHLLKRVHQVAGSMDVDRMAHVGTHKVCKLERVDLRCMLHASDDPVGLDLTIVCSVAGRGNLSGPSRICELSWWHPGGDVQHHCHGTHGDGRAGAAGGGSPKLTGWHSVPLMP